MELAVWEKSFSHLLRRMLGWVFSRAKKGSWHFEKSHFRLTQSHACVSFASEKCSRHFEKRHFSTYPASWSSDFSERKKELAFWEKSFFLSRMRALEWVTRAKKGAGILRKVIFLIFPSEKRSWHFEKSHFFCHSCARSSELLERKRELAFWEKSFFYSFSLMVGWVSRNEKGSWHFEKSHFLKLTFWIKSFFHLLSPMVG